MIRRIEKMDSEFNMKEQENTIEPELLEQEEAPKKSPKPRKKPSTKSSDKIDNKYKFVPLIRPIRKDEE